MIKRSDLRAFETHAGTFLHEVAHAVSGTPDVSGAVEDAYGGDRSVAMEALRTGAVS